MIGMHASTDRWVDRHVLFLDVDRLPLVGAGGDLGQFPLIAEQQVEIAHVPLGRVGRPGAFDARGDGVGGLAAHVRVDPAEALVSRSGAFRLGAERAGVAVAVGLADGVAAAVSAAVSSSSMAMRAKVSRTCAAVFIGSGWPFTPSGLT
jgi:hypothetical protein